MNILRMVKGIKKTIRWKQLVYSKIIAQGYCFWGGEFTIEENC